MTASVEAKELRVSEDGLNTRLFVCDEEKIRAEARRRGVSVALVVRELIHKALSA